MISSVVSKRIANPILNHAKPVVAVFRCKLVAHKVIVSNPESAGLLSIDQSVIVGVSEVEDSLKFLSSFSEMSPGFIVVDIGKRESVSWRVVVDSCHPVYL